MSEWQPIETAPKDRRVLLFGQMQPFDGLHASGPEVFSGYWDDIDGAWCGNGSTWLGPFYKPTHWMPLPEAPGITVAGGNEYSGYLDALFSNPKWPGGHGV